VRPRVAKRQEISNPQVAGSSPAGDANKISNLRQQAEIMSRLCCTRELQAISMAAIGSRRLHAT